VHTVTINDIDIGSFKKDLSDFSECLGEVIVVSIKPGNDIARCMVPAFLDRGCLTGVTMMVSEMNYVAIRGQNVLRAIVQTCVKNGELYIDGLASNAFERSL
jgi:hypothetical protein